MEKLLSGSHRQSVPEKYIFPEEERAANVVHAHNIIPVIDLDGGNQDEVSREILKAGKEFGFFQVINHGIPNHVLDNMMSTAEGFFLMPAEDKALYYSEDTKIYPRLSTSQGYNKEKVLYWRDTLALLVHPLEEFMHPFPEKPANLGDIFTLYTSETKQLATRLLKLICIGLGLNEHHLSRNLSAGITRMIINNYPPCPDPSLTLGLPKQSDGNLLALVHQWNVQGLQVLYHGEWIGVDPIPHAFVVNFGMIIVVLTNGMLKAVEHRAVTNLSVARTSIFLSVETSKICELSPPQALVLADQNPPLYRPFFYPEFFKVYADNEASKEATMRAFLLKK